MGVRQNWLVRICILTGGRAYQIGNSVPRKEWQQMNDTSLKMKLLRLGAETTHPKEKRRRNDKRRILWPVVGEWSLLHGQGSNNNEQPLGFSRLQPT